MQERVARVEDDSLGEVEDVLVEDTIESEDQVLFLLNPDLAGIFHRQVEGPEHRSRLVPDLSAEVHFVMQNPGDIHQRGIWSPPETGPFVTIGKESGEVGGVVEQSWRQYGGVDEVLHLVGTGLREGGEGGEEEKKWK